MSRRRILNVASKKKQDNMLSWRPTDAGNPAGAGAPGDLVVLANDTITTTLFSPTARRLDITSPFKDEPSARTQSQTYARGYKEVSTYRVVGGAPFRHRRIVFALKGLPNYLRDLSAGLFTPDFYFAEFATVGNVRMLTPLSATFSTIIAGHLFRGFQGRDWQSPFNAKVDTTRVSLISDHTTVFNPPNESGVNRVIKKWYPLNKNLLYDDDENGETVTGNPFSVTSKPGMGDCYIIDFYQSTASKDASLLVNHEGTYYFHER